MYYFPGVPWDSWYDLPYDLVRSCVDFVDTRTGNED